jgi:hypothetical protein
MFFCQECDDAFAEFKIEDGMIDAVQLKSLMVSILKNFFFCVAGAAEIYAEALVSGRFLGHVQKFSIQFESHLWPVL